MKYIKKLQRPPFASAWIASGKIYSANDPGARVAQVIGGLVARNINNPNPKERWENTCAVRMSYILNQAGLKIPVTPGKTVTGGDGRQYFFRVEAVIEFLQKTWGPPDLIAPYPASGSVLGGKQGIILFSVTGWTNAKGHATLWNGHDCYDHCYFDVPDDPRIHTTRASFWRLS